MLDKFGVEMIGANADAIDKAEDRERLCKAMKAIGLKHPTRALPTVWKKPIRLLTALVSPVLFGRPLPWVARGAVLPITVKSLNKICRRGLDLSPTNELLIDESLLDGKSLKWKWSGIEATIVLLSVQLKILTPWAFTPVTQLPLRQRRP